MSYNMYDIVCKFFFYYLIIFITKQTSGSHIFWWLIWQLKIHNAEKMFMWRACHNLLSIKDNLRKRGTVSDFLCSICGLEIESTHHILWSCP